MNFDFHSRLVSALYATVSCVELDREFSGRFGREIQAWRLFRYLIRMAVPGDFCFNPSSETVGVAAKRCDSYEQFVTVTLHEATHGVCHFVAGESESELRDFYEKDEEAFCWKISDIVCVAIGVAYDKKLADNLYAFNVACMRQDYAALEAINAVLPDFAKGI
jgi:hypothetical protein